MVVEQPVLSITEIVVYLTSEIVWSLFLLLGHFIIIYFTSVVLLWHGVFIFSRWW